MKTLTGSNAAKATEQALDKGKGILRLSPTWVPRSFLQPGRRIKLDPRDLYAYGADRGGIDERWFASTTVTDNEGRGEDEGLSYVVVGGERFTLKDAIDAAPERLIGKDIWGKYGRWPVYSKFFDNMGPIPHHMHQSAEQAKLIGREGKPESYYFPPQLNSVGNNFPYTFFGLEPGTTKEEIVACLDRWNEGDNGILDYSKAYRLKPGTGWLVPPCVLHAPGSLVTYEPQWGSDVFGMYQSIVEGRYVPRSLLTKDFPEDKADDNQYLVDALDWDANVDTHFKDNHYLEPIIDSGGDDAGWVDKWVVYGKIDGEQLFSAKELTVKPGQKATIKDMGASGAIVVQGIGKINDLPLDCPSMIGFNEMTEDEVFISEEAALAGYTVENTSRECPLVILRYFGPEVNPQAPQVGDARK